MSYLIRKCFLLLIFIFFIQGCQKIKREEFYHEESRYFYKSNDFYMASLESFKIEGVLLVVDVKKVSFDDYIVWIGSYSDEMNNKGFRIKRVIFYSGGVKINALFEEDVNINSEALTKGLYKSNSPLKVIEINAKSLNELSGDNGVFTISVLCETENESKVVSFLIKRNIVEEYVFPT